MRAGLLTCIDTGRAGELRLLSFLLSAGLPGPREPARPMSPLPSSLLVAELSQVTASWKVCFPKMRGYFQDEMVLWLFVAESLLIVKEPSPESL